jgi:hypothetical protein
VALHVAAEALLRLLARLRHPLSFQEESKEECEERDHDRPADELGRGELPAHQDHEDDPELDDQVGRGDLERHRGAEARALLEQRSGEGDRGVRARRARGAEQRGHGERSR